MSRRETAWRVLANEFSASNEEIPAKGEKEASYLLSPLGARMNRVLIAGSIAPAESVGRDEATPFLRSRLTDPTGSFTVTAGNFQPKAMDDLKAIREPTPVLVVGKARLFRGRDGIAYTSVRAESVSAVSETVYRAQLVDTVRQTVSRIALAERLREPSAPDDATLRAEGVPELWVRAGREARDRYPAVAPGSFRAALGHVLDVAEGSRPAAPVRDTSHVRVVREPPKSPPPAPSPSDREVEGPLLELIDELSEGSADGYADLKTTLDRAREIGLSPERTEALIDRLEEEGVLEEPLMGKLRRA